MRRLWPFLASIPLVVACSSDPSSTGSGGTGGLAAGVGGATGAGSTTSVTGGTQAGGAGGAGGAVATGPGTTGSGNSSTTAGAGSSTSAATTGSGMMAGGACSNSLPEYQNNNGSVTYYTLDMGSQEVNCSYAIVGKNPDVIAHVSTGNGHYFGAMNTADYDNAAACGACVEVTRDGNKKVIVTVVDQCPVNSNPKCKAGHIDLSLDAFLQIASQAEGYVGSGNGAPGGSGTISWRYVACPTAEQVAFRLKAPTNQFWNEVLVAGHRYPITKVEVNVQGQWVSAVRQSYNYWTPAGGNMGTSPYQIRATDINGDTIEGTAILNVAGDQVSQAQFPVCE